MVVASNCLGSQSSEIGTGEHVRCRRERKRENRDLNEKKIE